MMRGWVSFMFDTRHPMNRLMSPTHSRKTLHEAPWVSMRSLMSCLTVSHSCDSHEASDEMVHEAS